MTSLSDVATGRFSGDVRARALPLRTPGLEAHARRWIGARLLEAEDVALLDVLADRVAEHRPRVLLALCLAMRAPRLGSVGVDLGRWVGQQRTPAAVDAEGDEGRSGGAVNLPVDAEVWLSEILESPLVGGPAESHRPFCVQRAGARTLVMSRRQWASQEAIALALLRLAADKPTPAIEPAVVEAYIDRLYKIAAPEGTSREQFGRSQDNLAIAAAASNRLTVITGGPGTGKTFSVKRLLALLLEQPRDADDGPLRISLAAPTGKAGVRMAEAMAEELDSLGLAPEVFAVMEALEPKTLHKLLRMRPDGVAGHGAGTPLNADVVVVDEASMIDLTMMRHLLAAIGPRARLILLGDRDQLASVDAGTVLSDIVSTALDTSAAEAIVGEDAPLCPCIVHFTENHRFDKAPRIAQVAQLIQRKGAEGLEQAVALMEPGGGHGHAVEDPIPDRIRHLGAPQAGRLTGSQLDALTAPYLDAEGFGGWLIQVLRTRGDGGVDLRDTGLHRELLERLDHHRVLAAHRRGPLGVEGVLKALESKLFQAFEAAYVEGGRGPHLWREDQFWLGRPVLIRENAYDLDLMNGDIGIVLPVDGVLRLVFPGRGDASAPLRSVALSRLPANEGALAMTIHKSQGSQFRRVAMILADRPSPIQTRELVYTAMTRARERIDWIGSLDGFARALDTPVQRSSGLSSLLWDR